jgi:hypothetical protein
VQLRYDDFNRLSHRTDLQPLDGQLTKAYRRSRGV